MSNGRLNEDRKRGGGEDGARARQGERSAVKGVKEKRERERREGEENGVFSDSEVGVSPPLTKRSRRKGSHSSGLALSLWLTAPLNIDAVLITGEK